jgi:hypothetical protein
MSPSVPTTPAVDVVDESGGDKGLKGERWA